MWPDSVHITLLNGYSALYADTGSCISAIFYSNYAIEVFKLIFDTCVVVKFTGFVVI